MNPNLSVPKCSQCLSGKKLIGKGVTPVYGPQQMKLLFDHLPHLYTSVPDNFYHINPFWQIAYINGSGWLGNLLLHYFLVVEIHDEELPTEDR